MFTRISCDAVRRFDQPLQYIKWKEGFFDRQREYIAKLLGRKWTCDNPEHELCVPTVDGRHVELTDKQFEEWVNAIVRDNVALLLGEF